METQQIPADIRSRIIEAANSLYENAGRERLPTVAAVRFAAQVDMNATTIVMREWKRLQTAQPAPVAVSVPDLVQQAASEAVAVVWTAAQELANASLRSAQASWDKERAELDDMRQELSELTDAQRHEIEGLNTKLGESQRANELAQEKTTELAAVIEGLRIALAESKANTERAEARIIEIEHRADDLKNELARAHEETDYAQEKVGEVRAELSAARNSHHEEMKQLKAVAASEVEAARIELATVKGKAEANEIMHAEQRQSAAQEALKQAERFTKVQGERDAAQKAAGEARENAARLSGQLEALQTQNAAFLARIGETKPDKK